MIAFSLDKRIWQLGRNHPALHRPHPRAGRKAMTLSPGFCRGLLQLDITSAVLEAAAGEVGCAEGGKGSL